VLGLIKAEFSRFFPIKLFFKHPQLRSIDLTIGFHDFMMDAGIVGPDFRTWGTGDGTEHTNGSTAWLELDKLTRNFGGILRGA